MAADCLLAGDGVPDDFLRGLRFGRGDDRVAMDHMLADREAAVGARFLKPLREAQRVGVKDLPGAREKRDAPEAREVAEDRADARVGDVKVPCPDFAHAPEPVDAEHRVEVDVVLHFWVVHREVHPWRDEDELLGARRASVAQRLCEAEREPAACRVAHEADFAAVVVLEVFFVIADAQLVGFLAGVDRLFRVDHEDDFGSSFFGCACGHRGLLVVGLVDVRAAVEVENGLRGVLLIIVDEGLKRALALFAQGHPELRALDDDRLFVCLSRGLDVGLALVEVGKLVAPMLHRQHQIHHPCHKRAVVDEAAVDPEPGYGEKDNTQ